MKFSVLLVAFTFWNQSYNEMLLKGDQLYRDRKIAEAAEVYETALKLEETDVVHFKLALCSEKLRQPAEAQFHYKMAIEIDAKPVYFNNLGMLSRNMGNDSEAEAYFNSAIILDSTYAQSWFNLGVLNFQNGEGATGCDRMIKAYDLGLDVVKAFIDENCI